MCCSCTDVSHSLHAESNGANRQVYYVALGINNSLRVSGVGLTNAVCRFRHERQGTERDNEAHSPRKRSTFHPLERFISPRSSPVTASLLRTEFVWHQTAAACMVHRPTSAAVPIERG